MAHRARFRNSLIILVLACFAMGCNRPQARIPAVYVLAADNHLRQRSGRLYLDGQPFSGYTYGLHVNGDTAIVTPYHDGREEGWLRQWYPAGTKMEERFYTAGLKQGQHSGWWPDGKPRFLYHFQHDLHEGEAEEWFSNGQAYRKFHYHEGQEEGRQQMWWPDGRIRANYVVKDGEQFGLIGRKLCKNPVHEVN